MITKNIGLAEMLIDPDLGRIWINTLNCVLRIQGINFKDKREKFSMIDINGNNGAMIEGNLSDSPINDFIEKLTGLVINNNWSNEDMENIIKQASLIKKEN